MPDTTWVLEVLGDIEIFAELNHLPKLTAAMHHAQAVLVAESVHNLKDSDSASVMQTAVASRGSGFQR